MSQQIKILERSLGAQLFIRGSDGVQLTEAGGALISPWSGYGTPPTDDREGWGPWLARHLTDTLEVGRGVAGPAVQLTVRRNGADVAA